MVLYGCAAVSYTWAGSKGKVIICGTNKGGLIRFKEEEIEGTAGVKLTAVDSGYALADQAAGYLTKAQADYKESFACDLDQKVSNIAWVDAKESVVTHGSGLDYVFATAKGKGKDATFQTYNTDTDVNQFLEDEEDNPEPGIDTQFYFGHIKDPAWNLLLTMNSKSRTAEMLHRKDDAEHWARLSGHGIEELPKVELSRFDDEDKYEFPLGMGIDYTDSNKINPSQTPKINDEFEHQPSPRMLTLTNDGVITMYQALNMTASQASPDTPYVCMKQTVLPIPAPDPRLTAKPTSNTRPVNHKLLDLGRAL